MSRRRAGATLAAVVDVEDLSGRTLGEFVLRARMDEGGFGAVYRCEQRSLGREAVVKVLHPRLRRNDVVLQRFAREAQLASRLDHPCAAHVYAFGIERDDGLFWIAMEMVQGTPLHRWLRDRGPLPLDAFVPFFEQLADVVHAAHERGIIHRDLKPSNVMVIERGGRLMPKLLDFGVAKLRDPAQPLAAADAADAPLRASLLSGPASLDAAHAVTERPRSAYPPAPSPDGETVTSSAGLAERRDLRQLTRIDSMLGSPPYMSPEQWTHAGDVGPASDLYALAVVAYEAITGRRPFVAERRAEYAELHCEAPVPPVGEDLPPGLDRLFARGLAKRPEQRWPTALALAAALRAEWIASTPGRAAAPDGAGDEPAPYLGLASYAASDAARYVGREAEVTGLLDRLRRRALQVVVGPSGAGKSSFVHAGVIAQLPADWRAVTLRPGAAPLAALAFRLAAAGVAGGEDLRQLLASAPASAAARVAAAAGGGVIVVVIDQLEELFTLCNSAEDRGQFAAAIAQLAASADLPVRVIATIRDDFLMRLDALSALRPLLSSALVLLGNPLPEDLVRIVVEPARRAGYALSDPALADDMVAAVASRPGALAVLSFTALRLWQLRDPALRQLTRSAYDAMGGVGGALARHAEETFAALSADEQRVTREAFRHLVTADGTRAQLTAAELGQRLAQPGTDAVLDKLMAARLIAAADPAGPDAGGGEAQVELIHEALIEGWPRLQGWIRDDVDGARMREQLRVAARQWSERGRPRGLLWRDDVLVDLRRWLRGAAVVQLGDLERAFVAASLHAARRARARRILGLVAAGFAIAAAAFVYSWVHSAIGRRAAEQRVTELYADRGREALLDGKRSEALAYLAQAARRGDDSPAVRFMFERAAGPRLGELGRMTGASRRMWSVAFSPDGTRIVTTEDVGATIWDAASLRQLAHLPHDAQIMRAAFARNGSVIATAGTDGVVRTWDAVTGAPGPSSRAPSLGDVAVEFVDVAVSPDGNEVAAIDGLGRLAHVWNLVTGAVVDEPAQPRSSSYSPSLRYSRDGRWLATNGGDDVLVYDTHSWKLALTIAGPEIDSVSFDPTGSRLATASQHGDVSIWGIPDGRRVQHLHDAADSFYHVEYSPDGAHVAASDRNGIDRVWNTGSGELELELKNHRGTGLWIGFDPASRRVVSGGADGSVAISDIARGTSLAALDGPRIASRSTLFDPAGERIVAASWDGTARVWSARSQYLQWDIPEVGSDCGRVFSGVAQGRFLAVSCSEHGARVWDTTGQQLLAELPSPTLAPDMSVPDPIVVSADGARAALAAGNQVAVYALPGGALVRAIPHPAAVTAIAFARTGHDLISGARDGSLRITRDGEAPIELPPLPAQVRVVEFVAGDRVATADERRQLRIHDVRQRTVLAAFDEPSQASAFRVSPDGSRLLVLAPGGVQAAPVLYDLQHLQLVGPLDGNPAMVFEARFVELHGEREVLTASNDGVARLWDATTGRLREAFVGSTQYVVDAAVDPSGELLVTAGGDGLLRFWDIASSRMLWTLHAHHAIVSGVHFDGRDLVTRTLTGAVARWRLPELPASPAFHAQVDRVARCLPLRVDDATGRLIEQSPSCE